MSEPLYQWTARVAVDGARLDVLGAPAGPAGVSAVDLSDGSVWEVDHARPDRLVGLDVDAAGDPTHSGLLVTAFGADGALFVAEVAVGAVEVESNSEGEVRWVGGRLPRDGGWAAEQAGRLVLLTDLATDDELPPLARIAAAAELAVTATDDTPGGALLVPLVPVLLEVADESAVDVDDVDLGALDPKLRSRLDAVLRQAALDGTTVWAGLERLADRIAAGRQGEWFDAGGLAADMPRPSEDEGAHLLLLEALPEAAASSSRDAGLDAGLAVTRAGPGVAHVTTTPSERERWVRVSRPDGLVLVALSRLLHDGLVDRAEVAVPDRLEAGDLLVEIVDVEELVGLAGQIDVVRAAVRAGRAAARASRLGRLHQRADGWERCAVLWESAGDVRRAQLARDLVKSRQSQPRVMAPIADEVSELGL